MTTRRSLPGSVLAIALVGACGGGGVKFDGTGGSHTGTSSAGGSGTGTSSGTTTSSGGGGQPGTGGSATTSASTGTGTGTGGSGGCSSAADCSDGFSCTVDACNAGVCSHTVGPETGPTACPSGSFCLLDKGCVAGIVCATTAQCVTALGSDPCKANITCDPATAICTYTTLDKDGDGHAPIVCGGDDCNDDDPTIYPGAPEICDGKDNNCNGIVDEGATCPGLGTCTAGACVCPPADLCGTTCTNPMTDPDHCGTCATQCPSGGTCVGGICQCGATATVCSGACVDLQTDPNNCNGCGNTCAPGYACQAGTCTCLQTSCGGACVDTTSDPAHCGSCAGACPAGDICQGSACAGCPTADLFILQDLSASMATTLGTATRFQDAVDGINAFATESASTVGLGLGYFPLGGGSCVASTYSVPSVDIGLLPGNAATIAASLAAESVGATSSSPQAPALQGALAYVSSYEGSQVGHMGALVLVTDGLPDACTTPGVATDVATIAASFAAGTPRVKTFVVSLGADVQGSLWNTIAAAGGTGAAVQVTDPTTMYNVQNALDGVRTVFAHCGTGAACAHAECTASTVLDASCSTCATAVCLQDPYCCVSAWDGICVSEVPTFCAPMTCP